MFRRLALIVVLGGALAACANAAGNAHPPTRITGRVRFVTVSVRFLLGRRLDAPTVRAPAKIAKIVSATNHLPPLRPGAYSCPVDRGPNVVLGFFGAAHSPPLATVDADGSGCGLVMLTVRGRRQSAAQGGPGLITRLIRLGVLPRSAGRR
jgi:hypothetical protein